MVVLLVSAALSFAEVSENNGSLNYPEFGPNQYGLHISPGHVLWFEISPAGFFLPTSYTVGGRHDWFEVNYNQLVDYGFVSGHAPFVSNMTGVDHGFYVAANQPFYIGYWLATFYDGSLGPFDKFGWVSITWDGETAALNADAQGGDQEGIYAGTLKVVPEPATSLLVIASGLAIFAPRRRR